MNNEAVESTFRGNAVSPGLAVGTVLKLDSRHRFRLKTSVPESELGNEVGRLRHAVDVSKRELELLRARLEERAGKEHGLILDAHLLMLEDPGVMAEIEGIIRSDRARAEWALQEIADRIRRDYESLDDEYFRERGKDFQYVVERLQSALAGDRQFTWEAMPDAVIIVARDLSPSAFAAMDLHKVRGVALESGGRTSHVAILARSMRLPMLMDVRGFVSAARTGDSIILDAVRGELILRPTPDRLAATSRELQDRKREEPAPAPPVAARTLDDVPISLRANTELPHEVVLARNLGAEGIGLFRSEFVFFMHPNSPPDMDEQCEIYSMLAGEMTPHPVAVRTLDTGVDRLGSQDGLPAEPNPSMGLRGIRLSLASRRLFSRQVEAIYRAAAHGNIEMVLPMVSTVEEVWEAKRIAEQVRADLQQSLGHPVAPLPLGVMIEVPAAVFTLDVIAREVDFLCVGTNDLVQYLLAVDRDNPQVAHLFQPIHPSVLQCLSRIACIANRRGIPARICGEMSSNPFFAVLLIGMGFRQLSMNAFAVPAIRSVVCKITTGQAGAIAEKVLDMTTVQEISAFLRDEVPRLLGEELGAFDADLRKRITIATETG